MNAGVEISIVDVGRVSAFDERAGLPGSIAIDPSVRLVVIRVEGPGTVNRVYC